MDPANVEVIGITKIIRPQHRYVLPASAGLFEGDRPTLFIMDVPANVYTGPFIAEVSHAVIRVDIMVDQDILNYYNLLNPE